MRDMTDFTELVKTLEILKKGLTKSQDTLSCTVCESEACAEYLNSSLDWIPLCGNCVVAFELGQVDPNVTIRDLEEVDE